ncbi:MAG: hypothetical protein B7Y93_07760 [Micrococcales bacterium 32-70-13]|nr:MAG: hypothetical protein B7Y93_07760 [Micrococcales bacterium 32-70-13]
MGIIGWIILGLIAGAIAKAILPGNQGGGWVITLVLGVVGASPVERIASISTFRSLACRGTMYSSPS